ncbi:hypothetical protein Hanom_Chr04g00333211 [Helianthus anomalus]
MVPSSCASILGPYPFTSFVQIMDGQAPLEVIKGHNQEGYLSDPPTKYYVEFKSMIMGLNTCKIAHALRENPIIYTDLIQDSWKTTSINRKGVGGAGTIKDKIQGK